MRSNRWSIGTDDDAAVISTAYAKVMADAVPVPIALGHVAQSFHDLGMSELQQLRECNANQAEQIRTLNAAFTELAGSPHRGRSRGPPPALSTQLRRG